MRKSRRNCTVESCLNGAQNRFSAFLVLLLLVFLSCAEVVSPPGGEVDRTGPWLIGSEPENEAVQVASGNQITLYFSEPVMKPTSGNPVFISPRPYMQPKIKWKSERIIITLADSFNVGQTYIVTVSSSVTDLRRNRLDSSSSIAFSTGTAIDTGRIGGCIFKNEVAAAGAIVALYDILAISDITAYDSLYPDYVTTSNTEGRFSFQYLPPGEYRLVGFLDQNRNEQLNPFRESFAIPDRHIVVGGELPLEYINMRLISLDTLKPTIISASQTSDRLVRVRFSRKVALDQLSASPSRMTLSEPSSDGAAFPALSFLESDLAESASLTIYFSAVPEGTYRLDLEYDSTEAYLTDDELEIKRIEDKTSPAVATFEPVDKPIFVNQVHMRMVFSEPMDTSSIMDQTFMLWHSETHVVPLTWQWIDEFHLWFEPETLRSGRQYRLDVTEFDLVDLAGNLLGDSLRQFTFSTLDSDSLGWISGEVVILTRDSTDSPAVLCFRNTSSGQVFDLSVTGQRFKIDVPAGRYLLSGFIDSDKDGVMGNGSLFPFAHAETMAFYPDTIAVRARFETSDILFEFR